MSNYTFNEMSDDPNHVWNKLLAFIPKGTRVLDIGCSSGTFGNLLKVKRGCIVDGIEIDKADAARASKILRKVWVRDIEHAATIKALPAKAYDVIIFADVLEHLVHPAEVLRAIKKVLAPDGRVVFSVPNMAHVSVRLSLLQGIFEYTETGLLDKTHMHFYDLSGVRRLFDEAGMSLKKLDASQYRYTEEWLYNRLTELGLMAKPVAYDLLRGNEASAFQYVGYATYAMGKPHANAVFRQGKSALQRDVEATTAVIHKHEAMIAQLIQQLADAHQIISTLETEQQGLRDEKAAVAVELHQANLLIAELRQEIRDVHARLHEVTESKAFKTANVLVSPYRVVRHRLTRPGSKRQLK